MEKVFFAPLLVQKLGQADFYRMFFARFLTVVAILISITGVILFTFGWKIIFEMSSQAMVGGIVFQVSLVLAAYQAVHLTLLRAAEVRQGSKKPAPISTSVAMSRLVGEVFGFSASLLGVGGGILVWFAGREAGSLLKKVEVVFPFLNVGGADFLGGSALVVKGLGYGILSLLLGYLLAELLQLVPSNADGNQAEIEYA